jgi:hypothetical protein
LLQALQIKSIHISLQETKKAYNQTKWDKDLISYS